MEFFIEAIADFDDSEFSKCEIEIMDYVLVRYGNMTASDLFLETCKKDSLWYRAAVVPGYWKHSTGRNAITPTCRLTLQR